MQGEANSVLACLLGSRPTGPMTSAVTHGSFRCRLAAFGQPRTLQLVQTMSQSVHVLPLSVAV
jgi:hypothetical protein